MHMPRDIPLLVLLSMLIMRTKFLDRLLLVSISIRILATRKNLHKTRGVMCRHTCLACFCADGKAYPQS